MKYQVRRFGGEIAVFETLDKAFAWAADEYDKVSWTEGNGRIILRANGTWEYWSPETLRQMMRDQMP